MAHSQFQGLLHPPDTMIKQPVVNLTTNEATDIVVKEDRIEMVSNVSSTVSYPTHEDHKIRFIKSLDLLCQDTAADRSNEKQHTTVSRTVVAVVPSQPRTLGAQRPYKESCRLYKAQRTRRRCLRCGPSVPQQLYTATSYNQIDLQGAYPCWFLGQGPEIGHGSLRNPHYVSFELLSTR